MTLFFDTTLFQPVSLRDLDLIIATLRSLHWIQTEAAAQCQTRWDILPSTLVAEAVETATPTMPP
ncbi:MAG: hypothetical protein IPP44_07745 [Ideonella sp.]|nr:hypothetical protein [Ideonella sp.]